MESVKSENSACKFATRTTLVAAEATTLGLQKRSNVPAVFEVEYVG